eukprot:6213045-Pleurochrysis_carterae.AAC.1
MTAYRITRLLAAASPYERNGNGGAGQRAHAPLSREAARHMVARTDSRVCPCQGLKHIAESHRAIGTNYQAGVLHKSGLASTKTHIDEPFRSNSPYDSLSVDGPSCVRKSQARSRAEQQSSSR